MGRKGPKPTASSYVADSGNAILPDPPSTLNDAGREAWNRLGGELSKRGSMSESTLILLERLSACHGRISELEQTLEELTPGNPAQVQWYRLLQAEMKTMISVSKELMLSPMSKVSGGIIDDTPMSAEDLEIQRIIS